MFVWLCVGLIFTLFLGTNGCTEGVDTHSVSPVKVNSNLKITAIPPVPGVVADLCLHFARDAPIKFKEQMILADQGNATAQYKVGTFYYIGNGVERNTTLAAFYFKMAADQGLVKAQQRVGEFYLRGTGVSMDKKVALQYFELAGDQGDEMSQFLYEYNGGNSTRYGYIERDRKNRESLRRKSENSTVSTGSVTTGGLRSSSANLSAPDKLDSFVHVYTIVFGIVMGILFIRLAWYCMRRHAAKV